jgi:hypothetical protein
MPLLRLLRFSSGASGVLSAAALAPVYWKNPYVLNITGLIIATLLFAVVFLVVHPIVAVIHRLKIKHFVFAGLAIFAIIISFFAFSAALLVLHTYDDYGVATTALISSGRVTAAGYLDSLVVGLEGLAMAIPAWFAGYALSGSDKRSLDPPADATIQPRG